MPVVKKEATRTVLYPEIQCKICRGKSGLTPDQCKKLVGWEDEKVSGDKFGTEYLLKDSYGTKIRCHNNVKNRPLYRSQLATLKQEHLRQRWKLNGEPIIIGNTGLILNGQHTLISFILAAQELTQHPDRWPDLGRMIRLEKFIVFGIREDDETVNTMDTCKPRSLSDVLYRSEYFANMSAKDRKKVSRFTDYAIRLLWHRTGAKLDAFAPRRTHSESLDFLARHPQLLECVRFIYHTDGPDRALSKFLSPGYLCALLYLMACSVSDPDRYRVELNQDSLSWDHWDESCSFFTLLASDSQQRNHDTRTVKIIRTALAKVASTVNGGGTVEESCAVIVKAWLAYRDTGAVKGSDLTLEYRTDDDDIQSLAECPTVGGIDMGNPDDIADYLPSQQDIERASNTIRQTRTSKPTTVVD